MQSQWRTAPRLSRAWLLVAGLALAVPRGTQAQDFWWPRVVQSLTSPLDGATAAQVAEALPAGTAMGPMPPPIANPSALAIDERKQPVPAAVTALTPYIDAARVAGTANVATATGPWFLQMALAIKGLRAHGIIRDPSDCEAVVRTIMDSVVTEPAASPAISVFQAFAQVLRSVACAPAARQYARAESLMGRSPAGGVEPRAGSAPAAGQIAYNAFPKDPLPVTHCTVAASPLPVWILSNGTVVRFAGGITLQIGHLFADYSHHYPALLVLTGPPPLVYGTNFNGTLFRRAGAGPVTPAGQCE